MVRLSIVLPIQLRQKLKVQSALDGINMKDAVIRLIEGYVDKRKLHNKAYRLLDQLNAITLVETLQVPPSNHLEKLRGTLKEFWSIRINKQRRIIFKWNNEPLGLSQKSFSEHIGWTYTRLNEIINKHRGITADSALTLAEAFQTEPEFWLNLQSNWDLWHSLKKHRKVKPLNLNRRAA
ncbi:hypothetical protein FQR65_LT05267 [Abscondita terminalis]|nr:hypothetical protein FQR65_LT05267 [Abscondita terminalis]